MGRYSWNDLIINPNTEEAENAVGKECYFANNPMDCINKANWASRDAKFTLTYVKDDYSYPFVTEGGCFSCMIIRNRYGDLAGAWIKDNDIKVGDYVKITRKAQDYENGWDNVWDSRMDEYVGRNMMVLRTDTLEEGISLSCPDTFFYFPYFVLEKISGKYVPFTSPEEFISEYQQREDNVKDPAKPEYALTTYGMWIDLNGKHRLVTGIESLGIHVNSSYKDWSDILREYTFLDGSPCGKIIEE